MPATRDVARRERLGGTNTVERAILTRDAVRAATRTLIVDETQPAGAIGFDPGPDCCRAACVASERDQTIELGDELIGRRAWVRVGGRSVGFAGIKATDEEKRRVGWHYREGRLRLDDLLRPLGDDGWEQLVPACPGWQVRDVLAHLLGNTEDAAAGRLSGLPTSEQTDAQVQRHRSDTPVDLLDQWAIASPFVEDAITRSERWPAAIDALTHEHDIRSALVDRGARDHESIATIADLLAARVDAPVPVAVQLDREPVDDPDATLTLRTNPFEFFRLRLGRRSRSQVVDLDWSGDPERVVDHLFIFGPAPAPIIE